MEAQREGRVICCTQNHVINIFQASLHVLVRQNVLLIRTESTKLQLTLPNQPETTSKHKNDQEYQHCEVYNVIHYLADDVDQRSNGVHKTQEVSRLQVDKDDSAHFEEAHLPDLMLKLILWVFDAFIAMSELINIIILRHANRQEEHQIDPTPYSLEIFPAELYHKQKILSSLEDQNHCVAAVCQLVPEFIRYYEIVLRSILLINHEREMSVKFVNDVNVKICLTEVILVS